MTEFIIHDGTMRAIHDGVEVARGRVVETESIVSIGALSVDPGAPYGMFMRICRELDRYAGTRTVRVIVDYGPRMEKLVKLYSRFGGKCVGVCMEKN